MPGSPPHAPASLALFSHSFLIYGQWPACIAWVDVNMLASPGGNLAKLRRAGQPSWSYRCIPHHLNTRIRPQSASVECPFRNGPRSLACNAQASKLDVASVDLEALTPHPDQAVGHWLGVIRVPPEIELLVPDVGVVGAVAVPDLQVCFGLCSSVGHVDAEVCRCQRNTAPLSEQPGSKIDRQWPSLLDSVDLI